jgi:predicted NAD/FAD-binding protein
MAQIAIIGTGISGMGAAYLLNPHHTITVYEKNAVIGGHTRTRTVEYGDRSIAVDTGFIVFNKRNYPNLTPLFEQLGVTIQPSNMTFAATVDDGALEWCARDLNGVFGQRRNLLRPSFYRLLGQVRRFNREAAITVAKNPGMTLGELSTTLGLSNDFLNHYILPMGGAIWSAPPSKIMGFPAETFVRFFENHGLLATSGQPQWYTVTGGSQEYVKKITAPYANRIRLNCAVTRVTRADGKVQVTDVTGETLTYDSVVFASHADETLAMLADASDDEKAVLGSFTYQKNHAVLHKDIRVMPRHKRCWASWVYMANNAGAEIDISVTYWMNLLQSIDEKYPLFVTLNPIQPIPAELIFDRHDFTHPVFTREAIHAQARIPAIQGKRGSWFAGAYQRYGFHEDGLLSAVNVVNAMGVRAPWQ